MVQFLYQLKMACPSIAHNFFDPQPVKEAGVYLLQHILHDWSDPYAIKILRNLRDVAGEKTRLVVMESIVAHACHIPASDNTIPGGEAPEAPEPLLPNYGPVVGAVYNQDMIVSVLVWFWIISDTF